MPRVALLLASLLWACAAPIQPPAHGRTEVSGNQPTTTRPQLPSALSRKRLQLNNTFIGYADAPVQIETFTDFQCPFCAKNHLVLVELARRYPSRIRLRHKDFPLDSACNHSITSAFHADACRAAFFARCVGAQGRFWPFAARVFQFQRALGKDQLMNHARELKLDLEALAICVDEPVNRQPVLEDVDEAIQRGIRGTPVTFVSLKNGKPERVDGHRPAVWWDRKVGRLLDRWNRARSKPTQSPQSAPAQP